MIVVQELERDYAWRKRLQKAAAEYALARPRKARYVGYEGIYECLTIDGIRVRTDLISKPFERERDDYIAPAWTLVTFDGDLGGELGRVVFDDDLFTHVRFSIDDKTKNVTINDLEIEAGAINFATGILRSQEKDEDVDEDTS